MASRHLKRPRSTVTIPNRSHGITQSTDLTARPCSSVCSDRRRGGPMCLVLPDLSTPPNVDCGGSGDLLPPLATLTPESLRSAGLEGLIGSKTGLLGKARVPATGVVKGAKRQPMHGILEFWIRAVHPPPPMATRPLVKGMKKASSLPCSSPLRVPNEICGLSDAGKNELYNEIKSMPDRIPLPTATHDAQENHETDEHRSNDPDTGCACNLPGCPGITRRDPRSSIPVLKKIPVNRGKANTTNKPDGKYASDAPQKMNRTELNAKSEITKVENLKTKNSKGSEEMFEYFDIIGFRNAQRMLLGVPPITSENELASVKNIMCEEDEYYMGTKLPITTTDERIGNNKQGPKRISDTERSKSTSLPPQSLSGATKMSKRSSRTKRTITDDEKKKLEKATPPIWTIPETDPELGAL